jgi:hypothetical protein
VTAAAASAALRIAQERGDRLPTYVVAVLVAVAQGSS